MYDKQYQKDLRRRNSINVNSLQALDNVMIKKHKLMVFSLFMFYMISEKQLL